MKNALISLIAIDAIAILLIYLFAGEHWLMNSQIAFISSSFVMLGSMLSYKSMVKGRLNVGAIPDDERDTLDKLEDPYDLYDENIKNDAEKTLVEVVKEERANLKKGRRGVLETTKDAKASFSFYRLGAYALLIFGFFYLNSNGILLLTPYLIFLSLPMFIIVISLVSFTQRNSWTLIDID